MTIKVTARTSKKVKSQLETLLINPVINSGPEKEVSSSGH
jgi:phosphoribosylformylglycinamidine (FGAM) synthase PurS component